MNTLYVDHPWGETSEFTGILEPTYDPKEGTYGLRSKSDDQAFSPFFIDVGEEASVRALIERLTQKMNLPEAIREHDLSQINDDWYSIENFVLIKGQTNLPAQPCERALSLIAAVEAVIQGWEPLDTALTETCGVVGGACYVTADGYGVATGYVDLVDKVSPAGLWVYGKSNPQSKAPLAAKVLDGKPVAVVAPCQREVSLDR